MRVNSHPLAWFAGVALLLAVGTGFACSCLPLQSPKDALGRADAVFSGAVTEIAPSSREVTIGGQKYTFRENKVTFQVTETWKGPNVRSQIVYTSVEGTACGYYFVPGGNYLVYAYSRKSSDSELLETGVCSRTTRISQAADDLKVLDVGEKPKLK